MKKHIAVILAASTLVLAGGCTTLRTAKWEYKVATAPHSPAGTGPQEAREAQQAFLNDLGKDGWVLISQTDGRTFYFARLIK